MSRQPEWALALLRIVVGASFAAHGAQAIFSQGLAAFTAQWKAWHVPLPLLSAPLVAILQLAGGLLLALGLGSRALATALAVVSAGLFFFSHSPKHGWTSAEVQLPLLLLAGALAIAIGGPGKLAFDERARGKQ